MPAGDDASIEQGYQAWLKKHGIVDADSPQRTWNYRGAFLAGVDPDKNGQLPDVFRVDRMELGLDQSAGIYRPIGWRRGQGPTDPAYSNPGNQKNMELGYDLNSKIYRPIGSVPGESNEQRRKAGR